MQQVKLHLVSFDVPYPPDYGGAIDVFYKIKNLAEAGAIIYLHTFQYGRKEADILKHYCKEVWYYPRYNKPGFNNFPFKPYIVGSRQNELLLKRLAEIPAPILFEGIHTTFYHSHPLLKNRFKAVRIHNIEHSYYAQLVKKAVSPASRLYHYLESKLLANWEKQLGDVQAFFALSQTDSNFIKQQYPDALHRFIAPFHAYDSVTCKSGIGEYVLYQGNLAHPENREAVFFILQEIAPKINLPIVIAGRNPASDLVDLCQPLPSCKLVADPDEKTMQDLISNAHIHLLPTFQQSGVKLKLIHALFAGRHVIATPAMLFGTGLDGICPMAATAVEFVQIIHNLKDKPFTTEQIELRKKGLVDYDNRLNAGRIFEDLVQHI